MGISQFNNYIPVKAVSEPGSLTMTPDYSGKMTWVDTSTDIDFTLSSDITFTANAEIIIRNSSSSTGNITVLFSGIVGDISSDLGPVIPPGGIGELKRVGGSLVWAFYGYIQS